VLSSILVSPGLAWAGPPEPDEPPPGADEQAAHLLAAGNKAFKEGKFAAAEQAYAEAFALKKGYDISGNLGAAELAQGKLRACAQHLAFTLRAFPITGDPALREQMEKALAQCRRGAGAVRVDPEVRGATVLVDGRAAGDALVVDEVFVEPGEHVFEARLEGYTGAPRRVVVERGGAVSVTLPLTPLPPPPSRVVVQVVPARRRSVIPGLGMAAAAVVALGGGAAFLGASAGKRSNGGLLSSQILGHGGSCVAGAGNYDAGRCPTLQSDLRADDALHDAAIGAFVVGGAAAAATAAYFLWPQRAQSSGRGLRVTPIVGAGQSAVVLSGSF
jgi:hypothetical protein